MVEELDVLQKVVKMELLMDMINVFNMEDISNAQPMAVKNQLEVDHKNVSSMGEGNDVNTMNI